VTEETLAMLEERGRTVRSPSVRLLCAEVRRLRAALAHYADAEQWTAPPGHAWDELDKGYYLGHGPGYGVARAALAGEAPA